VQGCFGARRVELTVVCYRGVVGEDDPVIRPQGSRSHVIGGGAGLVLQALDDLVGELLQLLRPLPQNEDLCFFRR
jgi:hypothetical protein